MLGVPPEVDTASSSDHACCRYCQKTTHSLSTSRWKVVRSPLDTSGRNSQLPPPLRWVAFCSLHYKAWMPAAFRVLQTRVILSHVSLSAKPVFGAELTGKRTLDEIELGLGLEQKKKRRIRKPRSGGKKGKKKKQPDS
tara:strand:+ start:77 stop:490 length:414 start_codon:yes stop_codon:yes gene_type:complete